MKLVTCNISKSPKGSRTKKAKLYKDLYVFLHSSKYSSIQQNVSINSMKIQYIKFMSVMSELHQLDWSREGISPRDSLDRRFLLHLSMVVFI